MASLLVTRGKLEGLVVFELYFDVGGYLTSF